MGHVTDATIVPTNKMGDVPLAVVAKKRTHRKVAVWLSSKMLLTLFDSECPALGSDVYIKSLGTTVSNQSGLTYNRYSLQVEARMLYSGNPWIEGIITELEERNGDG